MYNSAVDPLRQHTYTRYGIYPSRKCSVVSKYNEKHSNFKIAISKSILSHKLVSYIITKVLKLIF